MPRPLKTLEELRDAANIRAKRWQAKQRQAGKKHISATIEPDVYGLICQERGRTGATLAKMIETAIRQVYGAPVTPPASLSINEEIEKTPESNPSIQRDLPSYHGQKLTREQRDSILIGIGDSPGTGKDKVEKLNGMGVTTARGNTWEVDTFNAQLSKARKRRDSYEE